MAKEILLMGKCLGVRNKGKFLGLNIETGETELSGAVNVFVDKEGKVRRRNGRRLLSTLRGRKDGFGSGSGDCLVKCGTSLYRMDSGLGLTGLRSGMIEGECSFSKIGKNTYYCDGMSNGKVVEGGSSYTWVAEDYVGPSTIRSFSSPPVGNLVSYYNSRAYIGLGKCLFYSEPLWYSGFDVSQNFIEFDSTVVMVKRFEKGLVVGTLYRTYVLKGTGPNDFERKVVDLVGPFAGSGVERFVQFGDSFFLTAMWTSESGVYGCDKNGEVTNIIVDKMDIVLMKYFVSGATVWDNYYIVCASPLAMVVNVLSGSVSFLSDFNYTTLFECFGKLIGGDDEGLYEIEVGNYDEQLNGEERDIDAWIKLPRNDWGISNLKGIRTVYIHGDINSVEVTSRTETGESTVQTIESLYENQVGSVNPGCNLQGCNWEFTLRNVEGGKFDLDAVSCLPVIKGKRVVGVGR